MLDCLLAGIIIRFLIGNHLIMPPVIWMIQYSYTLLVYLYQSPVNWIYLGSLHIISARRYEFLYLICMSYHLGISIKVQEVIYQQVVPNRLTRESNRLSVSCIRSGVIHASQDKSLWQLEYALNFEYLFLFNTA